MPPKATPTNPPPLPPIHVIRGQRVMLDSDLAARYGLTTIAFNQAIRRNLNRFPPDFLFQLTGEEFGNLKSQIAISSADGRPRLRSQIVILKPGGRGRHRKYLPLVFTEHGAIMAATILRSERAVAISPSSRDRPRFCAHARGTDDQYGYPRAPRHDRQEAAGHDVVLQDVVEKLLPLLNPLPDERTPKRRISFH